MAAALSASRCSFSPPSCSPSGPSLPAPSRAPSFLLSTSPTIWFPAPGCEAPRVASRQLAGDTLACRVLLEDGAVAPDSPEVPGDGQAGVLNAGLWAPWAGPVAVPATCPSSEAPLGRCSPSPGPAMASGSAGTQCAVTPGLLPTAGLVPGLDAWSLIRSHFLLKWVNVLLGSGSCGYSICSALCPKTACDRCGVCVLHTADRTLRCRNAA